MFDRRVLNNQYSPRPIKLFMAMAALMDEEDLAPSPPWVCPDGITIRQTFGTCPAQVGGDLYVRMSVCGHYVLFYDPEKDIDSSEVWEGEVWEWKDEFAHSKMPYSEGLASAYHNYCFNL